MVVGIDCARVGREGGLPHPFGVGGMGDGRLSELFGRSWLADWGGGGRSGGGVRTGVSQVYSKVSGDGMIGIKSMAVEIPG